MDQLRREFLADAEDLIEILFGDIQRLRKQHATGRVRRELTARIFRRVHTLKGTAAAAGLDVASHIAHEFETLLDALRQGNTSVSEPVLDAFDEAAHALSQTLTAAARGETLSEPLQLMENLRRLASSAGEPPVPCDSSATLLAQLPEEMARALSEDEARLAREAVAEGQHLFIINISFPLETFDERFRALSAAISDGGELISTQPGTVEAVSDVINFSLLYASDGSAGELAALADSFGYVTVEELLPETKTLSANDVEQSGPHDDEFRADSTSAADVVSPAMQVRVELARLEELMSTARVLMTEALAALDLAREGHAGRVGQESLDACAARLQQQFSGLEEQLTGLRRVPVGQMLGRAARAGLQAARAIGKDVAFELVGSEVRLDQTFVEAVSSSLLHLVRNAVGHGIETAEERVGAGKSARGTVRLEAVAEADRVVVKITDDGGGINLDSVTRAAVERGLIEAGRGISPPQAFRLIFRPGFSTDSIASPLSGRGVGLEVVERAIAQVGGQIEVRSEAGRGTTFELIVPASG